MIKCKIKEYSEGDLAIRSIAITVLGLPIYSYSETSTNRAIVEQLTVLPQKIKIKGFSHEIKNKSKKTK